MITKYVPSLRAVVACGVAAAVLVASVPAHLLFVVGVGGPGEFMVLVGAVVSGAAFVLLMAVMRDLLQAAIADRNELDEVI